MPPKLRRSKSSRRSVRSTGSRSSRRDLDSHAESKASESEASLGESGGEGVATAPPPPPEPIPRWVEDEGVCKSSQQMARTGHCMASCVLPNGEIATACVNRTIGIYHPGTLKDRPMLTGHTGAVNCVLGLKDCQVVSGSSDGTIKIWRLPYQKKGKKRNKYDRDVPMIWVEGEVLEEITGHDGPVYCMTLLAPDTLASGGADGKVYIWKLDLEALAPPPTVQKNLRRVDSHASVTSDASASESEVEGAVGPRSSVVSSAPSVGTAATAGTAETKGDDGDAEPAIPKHAFVRSIAAHEGPVLSLKTGPSQSQITTTGADGKVKIWRYSSGTCESALASHAGSALCSAATPDGKMISVGADGLVKMWDVAGERCLVSMKGHSASVTSCVVVSEPWQAVTGSLDGTIKVWDPKECRCVKTIEDAHKGGVREIIPLPGAVLLTTGFDGYCKVWLPKRPPTPREAIATELPPTGRKGRRSTRRSESKRDLRRSESKRDVRRSERRSDASARSLKT